MIAHARLQPERHRHLHRVPDHRQGPARHVRVRATGGSCRTSSAWTTTRVAPAGPGHRRRTASTSRCSCRQLRRVSSPPASACGSAGASAPPSLLLVLMAAFPLGYFFFWGITSRQRLRLRCPGPCTSSRCSCRCASSSPPCSSRCGGGAAGGASRCARVLTLATVPFLYDKSPMNHASARRRMPWQRRRRRGAGKSLVVRPRLGAVPAAPEPVLGEPARPRRAGALRGRPQGAADVRPASTRLSRPHAVHADARRCRPAQRPQRRSTIPEVATAASRASVRSSATVTLRVQVTNPTAHRRSSARLQVGDQVAAADAGHRLPEGDAYDVEWHLVAPSGHDPEFVGGADLVRPVAGPGSVADHRRVRRDPANGSGAPTVRQVIPFLAGDAVRLLLTRPGRPSSGPDRRRIVRGCRARSTLQRPRRDAADVITDARG